jgi:uncharacterized protein YabE (DUF348 family)
MYKKNRVFLVALGLLCVIALAACKDNTTQSGDFKITVDVDGERLAYRYNKRVSVGQFLEEQGVTLDEDDEVNPLVQTQVRDGMLITVTRVVERQECENEPLPYQTERRPTQNLPPNEEQIIQTGENGTVQVCYRIVERNGVPGTPVEINRIPIKAPRSEIIYVGSEPPDTLLPIEGVLTYISGGQAWIIEGNTANRNPLTESGYLDGRVFDLSADGRQLLYTRHTPDEDDPSFSNELWVILDTTATFPNPVQLVPEDVRVAQWVRPYTISYSTANPTADGAGWRAYNDLYLIQLDLETGEMLPGTFEEIISANALGSYAYWGRRLLWSPDGTQLAWANADSLGLVDLETGDFNSLMTFKEYAPLLERFQGAAVWIPTLSWSDDGHLVTTMHGEPYADEAPEDSIIFDMGVLDVNTGLQIKTFIPQVGIWSVPTYSPVVEDSAGNPTYFIAYFKARHPLNSPGTEYDLWVADRDGSNERLVFPGPDRPGLRSPDPEDGIAWEPKARQMALIYQNDLWIVDLKTGQAVQITSDGQASRPRWSRIR